MGDLQNKTEVGVFAISLIFLSSAAFAQNAACAKALNPDISVNLLGRFRHETHGSNDRTDSLHNGLSFEESEIIFKADVDPYFRASALFSLSQEAGTTEFGIEPEEVFFETIALPVVSFKAGKFKAALGKHNQAHTHAYAFIDGPLINEDLLGDEGLNDIGVSASVLVPTPWFLEFTIQGLGTNNDTLFNSADSRELAVLGSIRNLFDLTDDLTMEWGIYGVRGDNQFTETSYAYGSDLIFKWRPAEGGKYQAFIWQTEYLNGIIGGNPAGERLGGIASWLQYQFAQRWWIQAREEYEGLPHSSSLPTKQKQSALLGFFPSEFSGFRIQYDRIKEEGQTLHHAISLQYNISIGAHPAHDY